MGTDPEIQPNHGLDGARLILDPGISTPVGLPTFPGGTSNIFVNWDMALSASTANLLGRPTATSWAAVVLKPADGHLCSPAPTQRLQVQES